MLTSGFYITLLLVIFHVEANVIRVSPIDGLDTINCLNSLSDCASLDYVLEGVHQNSFDNITIYLANSTYLFEASDEVTTFKDMNRFELIGYEGMASIRCTGMTGLSFINSSNIYFENINILDCGSLHNSSSSDSDATTEFNTSYIPILVGVYFLLCNNISLSNVTVAYSPGTAVVFYSSGGNNVIKYSNFFQNGANQHDELYLEGGGGVAIEFLYCLPGDLDCATAKGSDIPIVNRQAITYLILNCSFTDNQGTSQFANGTDAFITPLLNHNVALGRGGGLGVVFKGDTETVQVSIQFCEFKNNSAVWGGGALFEFQDNASNNTVVIESTRFNDNMCEYDPCSYEGTGGGGVRVSFAGLSGLVKNNKVKLNEILFANNEAYFGGGISVNSIPEDVQTNQISFEEVIWRGNRARLGSAVDLAVWDLFLSGSVVQSSFKNCIFENNSVEYTEKFGTAVGTGTIYTDTVPIQFIGYVRCDGNEGSCIYSVEATVEFVENTIATFTNNVAYTGGGIALFSSAYIITNRNCSLEFRNNQASIHGGAIYWEGIGNRYLISSRNCFIQYKDTLTHPTEWLVTFIFDGNIAGVTGDDIFGTTLLGCLWGNSPYRRLIQEGLEFNQIFNWKSSIWVYKNYTNKSISTAPSHFIKDGETNCGSSYFMQAVPGKLTQLSIRMTDDKHVLFPPESLVFSAVVNGTDNGTQYLASGEFPFTGEEGEIKEFNIATLQPRIISSRVILQLQQCPYGFAFNSETESCIGAGYPFIHTHTNYTASIQRGYWVGSIDNIVIVSQCFFCPFNTELPASNFILLPNQENLGDFFCGGLQRNGSLCQQCIEGYAPAIGSERYRCVKCTESDDRYGWIIFILGKYLPITIILLIVIVLNISVTSGPANSFVVFAQLISTTFGVDSGQILNYSSLTPSAEVLRQLYVSLYGLWNLDFFESFDILLHCLGSNVSVLNLLILRYVTAAYPLVLLFIIGIILTLYNRSNRVVVFILKPFHRLVARFFQVFNLRRSIMDTFATFIVLSYAKFAVTSAYLLYPSPLVVANGEVVKYVSYLDSTKPYVSLEYAPYVFTAVTISLFIGLLLPTVLLLYSLKPFHRFLQNHRLSFLLPGEKTKYFLNSFYHCYKDGTDGGHDRRYFASLYFFVRFILIYSYSFAIDWTIQFMMQQILLTIVIIVISVFQPYKNHFYNVVDSIMFGNLAMINIFTIYQTYLDVANFPLSGPCFYIQIILVFLPLFYIVSIVFYGQCYKPCARKLSNARQKMRKLNSQTDKMEGILDDFSFGEFMENVDAEGRFKQVKYHGPMHPDELNRDVGNEDGNMTPSMTPLTSSIHLSQEYDKCPELEEPTINSSYILINDDDNSSSNRHERSERPHIMVTSFQEPNNNRIKWV